MLGGPGIASVLKARQGSLTFTWNENSDGGGGGGGESYYALC